MGGHNGEAGASPALSRNCDPHADVVSQDDRLRWRFSHSRGKEVGSGMKPQNTG